MHIIITGVHIDVTDAIQGYTFEKMKSLEKFIAKEDSSVKLVVELSKTTNHHSHGDVFQANAQFHMRSKEVSLSTKQDDLYKAIDVLKDMLARELAKNKDREQSLFRRGSHTIKSLFRKNNTDNF
ncbi:MAG: hypothetical protein RLZZ308_221 [Candidatus Parcubacteria bacterium]|jgi:putative sigma-54 modulation protein